jgi:hypothetical protein
LYFAVLKSDSASFNALFSRRNKLVPQPAPDKPGQISNRLRTLLWNDFDNECHKLYRVDQRFGLIESSVLSGFLQQIWSEHWAEPADDYPGLQQMMSRLKTGFFQSEWFFPFDIIELTCVAWRAAGSDYGSLRESVRRHLDQESSAYVLMGDKFVERMTGVETQSAEIALNSDDEAVRTHFAEALKKLSDRPEPC